jgi:hypothetical protein
MSTVVWHHSTPSPPQPPLPAPPLCQHTCIDVPKASAAAADSNRRNNAANVDGGHPPAVGNKDAVASITTTIPHPDEAPPPSSFVNARPLGGFTSTHRRTRWRLPLCCSARKPGMMLSFSRYSQSWQRVERWRNTTINRKWGLGVGSRRAAAVKALSLANDNHQRPPSLSRNTHSSDRGRSDGGMSNSLAPLSWKCRQHVGDMSATRRNVPNFRPNRPNLAMWFTVCWHTFVLLFPNIDVPRTDNICT